MSIIKNYQPTKGTCKVTFSYPTTAANGAKTVQVLGDFNNWDASLAPKMKAGKNEFTSVLELRAGNTYQFRYLLDGTKWDNDYASDFYAQSPFVGIDNSVLVLDAVEAPVKAAKPATKATATKTTAAKTTVAKATTPKATAPKAVKQTAKTAATSKTTTAKATAPKTTAPKAATAKVEKAAPVAKSKEVKTVAATTKKATAKATVAKVAAKSTKDDLTKIEGIGPKIAGLLNAGGIVTFDDLSVAKVTALKSILDAAGSRYKLHDPSTWPNQSALAAKGSWDALKKLQDELNGGKVAK